MVAYHPVFTCDTCGKQMIHPGIVVMNKHSEYRTGRQPVLHFCRYSCFLRWMSHFDEVQRVLHVGDSGTELKITFHAPLEQECVQTV